MPAKNANKANPKADTQVSAAGSVEALKGQVSSLQQMAEKMIEMGVVPKRRDGWKVEEAMLCLGYGQQLGMNPVTAINSITIVEGRPTIESKIIQGLLAQKGIAIKLEKDYEPVYREVPLVMKGDDGKPLVDENDKVRYYRDDDGKPMMKQEEIDRETRITIIRDYGGEIGVVYNSMSFYLSDARTMGLYPTKSNWMKMPRYMCFARCLARASRAFASDIVGGLYEFSELADSFDVEYEVADNDGEITYKVE